MATDESTVDDSKLKLPDVVVKRVELGTGEELEDEVYIHRARMYRMMEDQWAERCTGDLKLLKHRYTKAIRLVMRQQKTLKVKVNHYINPTAKLTARPSSEKAWIYKAEDWSDGEPKVEMYAVTFRDAKIAGEFKEKYEEACEHMKALAEGKIEAEEIPADVKAEMDAKLAGASGESKDDGVPETTDLSTIYAEMTPMLQPRFAGMRDRFKAVVGSNPDFFVRAPGRVNIIGEHIDYHGYDVMPMALVHDVVIAVKVVDAMEIRVINVDPKYPEAVLPIDHKAPVPIDDGIQWSNYVQCGYKGAFEAAGDKAGAPRGLVLMVHGAVPAGAGVSSSSALVVASLLATARANNIRLTRTEAAEAARVCELHIGTIGGGMDQAISCLAEDGIAMHIQFNPLNAIPVKLPAGAVFVVANSLAVSAKAETAATRFNKRVAEGKLAAKLIAKLGGLEGWKSIKTLLELEKALGLKSPGELVPHIEKLREGAYTKAELAAEFGEAVESLFEDDPKKMGIMKCLGVFKPDAKEFDLRNRALHVASESERVWAFQRVCDAPPSETTLKDLGDLMYQSQASCRDAYECSCEELDTLVALAKENGALGARLTGAGWGGCMVALVEAAKVEPFMKALYEAYYASKPGIDLSKTLFSSKPGPGAAYYCPTI